MRSIAEPRIEAERLYGNTAEADRLQRLLDEALLDSDAYIAAWSKKAGE